VQPATHPNNSLNLKTEDNSNPSIKQEGEARRRRRHASMLAVTTSYQAEVGAWQGSLRVTVCWQELLYRDDTGGAWVNSNLLLYFSHVALSVLVVLVPQPFYDTHNLTSNCYNYHYSMERIIVQQL
jgi:hypothetical protein